MPQNNSECVICGKQYHYCGSCKEQNDLAPWRILTDTSEHYKVFQIIRGYNLGIYTKEETRAKLSNVDLSDIESFKENIKSKIKSIIAKESEKTSESQVDIKIDKSTTKRTKQNKNRKTNSEE